ncbi:SDR family oxidoreductase [Oscillibacter sp. MSJ-2]|uniref:SDR family oxidoreductase n=1 Tax=Dysosmobacter acutus TaxID=2841504 RepID=A0ABS6F5M7_9FIRM|nr:glucose 1-dehydrogenase [Dysosmobacter acutus]MBU5625598.1 SDR family oxidoreductase [Dysosmobacter acutus]
MGKLDGKIAIVTGAAQGIGNGSAKVLAKHGATVILLDFAESVTAAAEEIRQMGLKADSRRVDVSKLEDVQKVVDDIVAQYGRIDILHNNAGVNRRVKFEDMDVKTLNFIFGVNIYGVWNMSKAVYPYMLKAGYGRIINTSSVTGTKVVDEGQTTYSMTKGAVSALTRALAYEAGPHGITVNAVLPGWVRTPKIEQVAADNRPEDPESAMRDMASFIPLKRLCNIEEIGDLVAFLASDDAKYITGTEVVIDGGSTLPETFNILHA